jgi:SAM-dependent methyltransferase
VTAAGIARLAGVGRAAVSNWRRRHADFPKPVGGTDSSPVFALEEVEQWLRAQGKLAEVPPRERVWQLVEAHPAGTATALRQTGAVLLLVRDRPADWHTLSTHALTAALEDLLDRRFGEPYPLGTPVQLSLLQGAAELAVELGPAQAYEFLLGRHLDANPRQYTFTPGPIAELMAALAGPAASVLDPACGTGALLRATAATEPTGPAPAAPVTLYAQERDPDLAALAALRLALHAAPKAEIRVRTGDTLRADAFPELRADTVLCHPPFNERNWGHDELAYDPRWEYGFPARAESELAWVQHALARVRDDGTAVLLMPPAAASRRSGRRVRADLLRRGALRAVIALPPGTAPPYGIPLHLWVLRKPGHGTPPAPHLLLVDTAELSAPGGEKAPWQTVRGTVLDAWRAFGRHGTTEVGVSPDGVWGRPGTSRAVPVIELLDDDVDLAPARHLPPPADGAADLPGLSDRLAAVLRRTSELAPATAVPGEPARWPTTTVGELARAGGLVLRAGGSGTGPGPAVLTEYDILTGTGPSGVLPQGPPEEPVLTRPGDVVVPVLGRATTARVIDAATAGAALGRNLHLLRPDPAALDPWFLAGFLRGTVNNRQASSYASTATRLDVRRLQLPRIPLADQQRYGARFRALAAFEDALRQVGQLGEQLAQGLYDGLTDGTVRPE